MVDTGARPGGAAGSPGLVVLATAGAVPGVVSGSDGGGRGVGRGVGSVSVGRVGVDGSGEC